MRVVSTYFLILVLCAGLGSCGFFDTIAGWFGANDEGSETTTALADGEVFAPTTEGSTSTDAKDEEEGKESHSHKPGSKDTTTEKADKEKDEKGGGKESTTKPSEHGEDKSEHKAVKKDSKEDDEDEDKDDKSKEKHSDKKYPKSPVRAKCKFDGSGTGKVKGTLLLQYDKKGLAIVGELTTADDLDSEVDTRKKKGEKDHQKEEFEHGFHIHEEGDISEKCMSTGGHFNPDKKDHGGPKTKTRHVGDLGNLVRKKGKILVDIADKEATLYGDNSVMGRSLVLHAHEDDLGEGPNKASKSNGNAGDRIACCVIEK